MTARTPRPPRPPRGEGGSTVQDDSAPQDDATVVQAGPRVPATPASDSSAPGRRPALHLSVETAGRIRAEVERAGGREVCFLASVEADGTVRDPRAVARGNRDAVLAVARDAPEGALMLHNHPSGVLEPSDADLAVAARVYEEGLGTAIVDNAAGRLYVVVEPPRPRRRDPLEVDVLEATLAPGGALSRVHPAYEDRPGQRAMLRLVSERYNEGGVAVVEAGTGTGKSVAYLLPAAAWAHRNGERTVVSTNTINLQEQLVAKDLPLVDRLLAEGEWDGKDEGSGAGAAEVQADGRAEADGQAAGVDGAVEMADSQAEVADGAVEMADGAVEPRPRWALVKGRGNYVSIRRARLAVATQASLFEDDRSSELDALLEWIDTTEDGSLADLPFLPSDEMWEEVRSDGDICLRARCPHFQECHYQKARRRAASAEILVVNHHLLFSDLAVRRATDNFRDSAVLPPYRHVVLDEAHNVEDAATSHLGREVTRRGLYRLLSRLERNGKGVLAAVDDRLRGSPDVGRAAEHRKRIEARVRPALADARAALGRFWDALEPVVPDGDEAVRIGSEALPEPVERVEVAEALHGLREALGHLEREVGELRGRLELDEEWEERLEGRLLDLRSVERQLAAASAALTLVLEGGDEDGPDHVRWVEWRGAARGRSRRRNLALAAAPVELGPLLRDSLFRKVDTAVLTSATLATRQGFEFLRERLGLDAPSLEEGDGGPPVEEAIVASPFEFARQSVLAVPTDLPGARSPGDAFQEATAEATRALAEITGGGIFVLFTSHRALRRVAALLREAGVEGRWPLFVHGEEDRARLLDAFVRSGRGILLGTASFWEGVDVPGHPLRGLILQKLPFRVPTEPVTAARVEAVERRGGNAFWQFMLPLAALRLKQGFGRLIRHRGDRGAVMLLDDRIVSRRYGGYLRESLPDAPLVKGPWVEVERAVREFYGTG